MNIEQRKYTRESGWQMIRKPESTRTAFNLVLAFGNSDLICADATYKDISTFYPNADILLCSTAGEIIDTQVNEASISLTAISFKTTGIKTATVLLDVEKDSLKAGRELAEALNDPGLRSIFVISDGISVNGSDLALGLQQSLPQGTIITGGLAGDGANFKSTFVGLNEIPLKGRIAAIGFYGSGLSVTYGSVGGWDPFGVERLITKSKGNILYELDGKPALDVYKLYLGEYAEELPGSGLLFPLSVRVSEHDHPVVRTILSVNESERSLTFAGNIPEGAYAQLMKANLERLIEGAAGAAKDSVKNNAAAPELAILISCVGRKLVLDQRIEEEVEVIRSIYGENTIIAGFYSYGEIAPSFGFMKCELHNQTMTITTLTEE